MPKKVKKLFGENPDKVAVLSTLVEFDENGDAEVDEEIAEVLEQIPGYAVEHVAEADGIEKTPFEDGEEPADEDEEQNEKSSEDGGEEPADEDGEEPADEDDSEEDGEEPAEEEKPKKPSRPARKTPAKRG